MMPKRTPWLAQYLVERTVSPPQRKTTKPMQRTNPRRVQIGWRPQLQCRDLRDHPAARRGTAARADARAPSAAARRAASAMSSCFPAAPCRGRRRRHRDDGFGRHISGAGRVGKGRRWRLGRSRTGRTDLTIAGAPVVSGLPAPPPKTARAQLISNSLH